MEEFFFVLFVLLCGYLDCRIKVHTRWRIYGRVSSVVKRRVRERVVFPSRWPTKGSGLNECMRICSYSAPTPFREMFRGQLAGTQIVGTRSRKHSPIGGKLCYLWCVNPKSTGCSHSDIKCVNPYETIRKYKCNQCGEVMMCVCDEAFGRRHRPHQLSAGTWLDSQKHVPVTLGFQTGICNHCRGLPEQVVPKAASPGRTSKIRRYYWREISMRVIDRFADWAEQNGIRYRPGLDLTRDYRDKRDQIEREVIEEIKAEHERSPKYQYQEKSSEKAIVDNAVEVIEYDATYIKGASKGKTIFSGGEIISVEEYAARSLGSQGYEVILTESIPFHVLFGCLMYRVVCDPADPFLQTTMFGDRHAFDRGEKGTQVVMLLPSDFGSADYGKRRAEVVAAHLSVIGDSRENLRAEFDSMFDRSEPLRQYLWAHREKNAEAARVLIEIIPCNRVVTILRYLFADYWHRYVGWPDLLVSRPKNSEGYFFAEVKGTGDKLSEQQKQWIEANTTHLLLPFKIVKIHRRHVVDTLPVE